MAQKQTITYVSDLSGKEITDNDAPTVHFSWDGVDYAIDLTSGEAESFHKAIEKYLSVATKTSSGRGRKSTAKKSSTGGPTAAEIRAWAKDNGYDVPERGRIPQEVREAFDAA